MPIIGHGLVAGALTLSHFATAIPMSEAVRRYAERLMEAAAAVSPGLEKLRLPAAAEPALA